MKKAIHVQKIKRFGWKPELPDARDILYKNRLTGTLLPIQSVDLSKTHVMPQVFDQGELGSCTGNGIASIMQFCVLNGYLQHDPKITMPFSRLFIYYNERVIEGTVKYDDGAFIRDGLKSIANQGACSDKAWPYIITKFANKPPKTAYSSALHYQAVEYQRLDSASKQECVDCLQRGFPFVMGFTVYTSFLTQTVASTGVVPMPDLTKDKVEGGHCTWVYGYDMLTDRYLCQNSWGENWGNGGRFTIPAAYLNNIWYADDFWCIKVLE